jgi:6-phosphofructokinase 1
MYDRDIKKMTAKTLLYEEKNMRNKILVIIGSDGTVCVEPVVEGLMNGLSGTYEVDIICNGWDSFSAQREAAYALTLAEEQGTTRMMTAPVQTENVSFFNPNSEYHQSRVKRRFNFFGVDGIVAIGGSATMSNALFAQHAGIPIIAVPNSITGDMEGTDYTVGYNTYVSSWRQIINNYIETIKSRNQVGLIEIPGNSGFATASIGIVTGASYIGVPEIPIDLNEMEERIGDAYMLEGHCAHVLINVSNLPKPAPTDRVETARENLAKIIEEATGFATTCPVFSEPFVCNISASDALLAYRQGLKAAEMVRGEDWGRMISLRSEKLISLPLSNAQGQRQLEAGSYLYDLVVGRNTGKF